MMSEELKKYCFQLINEVPYEMYVAILIVLCVGALFLTGLYGLKKGLGYFFRLLLVEFVFLLYASTVIFRTTMSERKYDFTPFWSYWAIMDGTEPQLLPENIMNVVAFLPFGLLAGLAFRRMNWFGVLAIGLGASVGIELLQFVFVKGFSEVDDVIHNTFGCMIGFSIYCLLRRVYKIK